MFTKTMWLSLAVAVLLAGNAYGADWHRYGINQHGEFLYDTQSLEVRGIGNVLRFMTKRVHADSDAYTLRQFEFDCLHRLFRILSCEIWGKNSTEPKYCGTFEYWNKIPADTFTSDLYDNICPKRRGLR